MRIDNWRLLVPLSLPTSPTSSCTKRLSLGSASDSRNTLSRPWRMCRLQECERHINENYAVESLCKDAVMRLEKLRDQKGARMKL